MKLPIYLILATIISCSSCMEKIDVTLLIGKWQGVEILIEDKVVEEAVEEINFDFKKNNTYTYQGIGKISEEGVFYTKLYNLYTTAEGQQEKVVKIESLTNDKLVLKMNDRGKKMLWTLKKIN